MTGLVRVQLQGVTPELSQKQTCMDLLNPGDRLVDCLLWGLHPRRSYGYGAGRKTHTAAPSPPLARTAR
jgi:hypothetical protein